MQYEYKLRSMVHFFSDRESTSVVMTFRYICSYFILNSPNRRRLNQAVWHDSSMNVTYYKEGVAFGECQYRGMPVRRTSALQRKKQNELK